MMNTEIEHIEFIKNPKRWPLVLLPVKNSKQSLRKQWNNENWEAWPVLGIVCPDADLCDAVPTVYIGNLQEWIVDPTRNVKDLEKIVYESVEKMVEDGWIVD